MRLFGFINTEVDFSGICLQVNMILILLSKYHALGGGKQLHKWVKGVREEGTVVEIQKGEPVGGAYFFSGNTFLFSRFFC